MAAKVDYEHRILAPTEYSLVEKRVLIDEVGRARDPGTGAIVNIGRRERIPLADEVQYNRQVALKEDYLQECKELRAQMSGLKAKLAASERRVAEYESSHSSYLEEISYLRNLTGVIYEKHRIDAYHNLGLGMKTQRLEAEVHNLRSQHERISSNLPVIENVEEVDTSQATRDAERIAGLEELVGDQDAEILKLQALLKEHDDNAPPYKFGTRVFQCTVKHPGVGYRNSPDFADKNSDGTGPTLDQYIFADAICQGPKAIFVRCVSGRGWLPLTNPKGTQILFQHLGEKGEVDVSQLQECVGKVKVGQGATYAVGTEDRVNELSP